MSMLHMDAQGRRKAIWLGAVLAPVLAVQIVRVFEGSGPASAPAALTPDATMGGPGAPALPGAEPAPVAIKPLTEAQRRALTFLTHYRMPTSLRSPMDGPDPVVSAVEPVIPQPQAEPVIPAPRTDPLAGLSLSAIVGSDRAAVAIISHRLRRPGDEVAPGWRVGLIDTRKGLVILNGPEGETATLAPPAPGE